MVESGPAYTRPGRDRPSSRAAPLDLVSSCLGLDARISLTRLASGARAAVARSGAPSGAVPFDSIATDNKGQPPVLLPLLALDLFLQRLANRHISLSMTA